MVPGGQKHLVQPGSGPCRQTSPLRQQRSPHAWGHALDGAITVGAGDGLGDGDGVGGGEASTVSWGTAATGLSRAHAQPSTSQIHRMKRAYNEAMDARARILARRSGFLAATLAACAPAAVPAPPSKPQTATPTSSAPAATTVVGKTPRPDADHDGIPDDEDACPYQPGGVAPWDPKKNGCPCLSIVSVSKIEIVEKVYFPDQSAAIEPAATPVLETIKGALAANPQLTYVKVVGHRDAKESKALSNTRAVAVRKWLVDHGIEASRLEVLDGGTTHADPDPAKNRRVEFEVP